MRFFAHLAWFHMKALTLRWFLLEYLILLISVIAISSGSNETGVGVSLNWTNDDYSFAAGASPWAVAAATVGVFLFVVLYRCEIPTPSAPMPNLFRRFVAGLIDWALALLILACFIGLINAFIEYLQTGTFEWMIERQEARHWDVLRAFGGVLIIFALMPLYIAIPMSKGRPTPGACILGYCIKPDSESQLTFSSAMLRALLGSIALLGWPCWIMAYLYKRDKEHGKFWLDAPFGTHAEFLR